MKPRNREVNIFNMSVLDLLTGALGAFCFLTLALFPSYYETQSASTATTSDAVNKEPAERSHESKGLEGPMPPFGYLNLSSTADKPSLFCAGLEVLGTSSESGGDLTLFPTSTTDSGSYQDLFLFAFQPGAYHLKVRATPFRMPCTVDLTLDNPNNNWSKHASIGQGPQSLEFDFNILATDLISNLWDNG